MAEAPKVQTVAEIMAELAPSTQGQQDVIAKQKAGLTTKYNAQRSGIEAAKVQGFNQINDQATGRGLAFSGIPLDEQANYLSTRYLPGMQQADFQQNEEGLAFDQQSAQLYTGMFDKAFGERSNQNSNLNSWNLQQQQLEATARENQLNREASAREAAASRSAAAARSGASNKPLSPSDAALGIISGAVSSRADINSSVFQIARDAYRRAGGDTKQFASDFWKYVPQSANEDNSASGWRSYYYG